MTSNTNVTESATIAISDAQPKQVRWRFARLFIASIVGASER
jgi:hypothetical protein